MLLEIKNLSVQYPSGTIALNDVGLSLENKDVLAVVGESGSGKSTLAFALIGLLPPGTAARGEIVFTGAGSYGPARFENLRATHIGLVMQEPASSFNPVLSIGSHFHELLFCRGKIRDKRAREEIIWESFRQVHIKPSVGVLKAYPHQFSTGQLQRLAIALAIVLKPALVIADEPTSSLDVVVESEIVNLFRELKDTIGLSILFITHNLGIVRNLADRVLVLHRGVISETGPCADIFDHPQNVYTKELIEAFKSLEG